MSWDELLDPLFDDLGLHQGSEGGRDSGDSSKEDNLAYFLKVILSPSHFISNLFFIGFSRHIGFESLVTISFHMFSPEQNQFVLLGSQWR